MPKKPIDYSKTIIYKIVCKNTDITDCYVGHTTNFTKRKREHKSRTNCQTNKSHNVLIYKFIREHENWDNWDMIMIEEFACENQLQAKSRERYWIELLKPTLNQTTPNRPQKEWNIDNKEHLKEYKHNWYLKNKENQLEKCKNRYENKKEEIKVTHSKYYQKNKENVKEKNKEYYENNKDKMAEYKHNWYLKNKEQNP